LTLFFNFFTAKLCKHGAVFAAAVVLCLHSCSCSSFSLATPFCLPGDTKIFDFLQKQGRCCACCWELLENGKWVDFRTGRGSRGVFGVFVREKALQPAESHVQQKCAPRTTLHCCKGSKVNLKGEQGTGAGWPKGSGQKRGEPNEEHGKRVVKQNQAKVGKCQKERGACLEPGERLSAYVSSRPYLYLHRGKMYESSLEWLSNIL